MFLSEIFLICIQIPTYCTSKSKFISIFRMLHLQRTIGNTFALRELFLCLLRDVISFHLLLMTRLTKMSCSPAKPLSDWAAELALKFNEIRPMNFTILNTGTHTNSWTFTTNQLLRLELSSLLSCFTIFHTSKVRGFALEALIVRKLVYWEVSEIIIEFIIRVFQPWIFINPFKFSPLHNFLKHIVFYSFRLV